MSKAPELLAPAGDLEKLKIAFTYGADAVYASTPKFSLRTREIGFTPESLEEGIEYAHSIGKKVYLTVNIFPHSLEIAELKEHLKKVTSLKPDALIVADTGLVGYLLDHFKIPIHLSTQANTVNQLTASFWQKLGVERIILARELSFSEIKAIRAEVDVPLESFIHGSMCMAYSGRCQISNYLTGRDPNRGECVQACRFKYKTYVVEEENRPGEYFPVYEDDQGTYIFNSKDLGMVEYIPELVEAGLSSLKIEGRLKSPYYLACVTATYRRAIDLYFQDPSLYESQKSQLRSDLDKISNRGYTTGFYLDKPDQNTNNYQTSKAQSDWDYVGMIEECTKISENKYGLKIKVKNRLLVGDEIEIVTPSQNYAWRIDRLIQAKDSKRQVGLGENLEAAHAGYEVIIYFKEEVVIPSFVRVKKKL